MYFGIFVLACIVLGFCGANLPARPGQQSQHHQVADSRPGGLSGRMVSYCHTLKSPLLCCLLFEECAALARRRMSDRVREKNHVIAFTYALAAQDSEDHVRRED
jgi:hypothetical protein